MLDFFAAAGRFIQASMRALAMYMLFAMPTVILVSLALQWVTSGFGAMLLIAATFPFFYMGTIRAGQTFAETFYVDDEE